MVIYQGSSGLFNNTYTNDLIPCIMPSIPTQPIIKEQK